MSEEVQAVCQRCSETCFYSADLAGTTQECTRCGAFLDIPSPSGELFGRRANRPNSRLTLPDDDDQTEIPEDAPIAMICPFCDESAEFEAAAAGATRPCPHCGEELDVLGSPVAERQAPVPLFFRCSECGKLVRVEPPAPTGDHDCPHCGETDDADAIAENRLTSGQIERLGLR